MSNEPATILERKRDRRGLLALIGAGGAAAVAALLSRNGSAEAGHDDTIAFHLGVNNTQLPTSGAQRSADFDGNAIRVNNSSTDDAASGVAGQSNGVGLVAVPFAAGLIGYASGTAGTQGGVVGTAFNGRGVIGRHGATPTSAPTKKDIGVLGVAKNATGGGTGVWGVSKTGVRGVGSGTGSIGVVGKGKVGVRGEASASGNVGVRGHAKGSGKVGVKATAANGATALEVVGGPMRLPVLTTVQRNALTAKKGMLIYNSTTNTIQARIVGSWVNQ